MFFVFFVFFVFFAVLVLPKLISSSLSVNWFDHLRKLKNYLCINEVVRIGRRIIIFHLSKL